MGIFCDRDVTRNWEDLDFVTESSPSLRTVFTKAWSRVGNKVGAMLYDTKRETADMDLSINMARLLELDGPWSGHAAERLPFAPDDATAGSENELQVAVIGARDAVDLPRTIQESSFYHDMVRRAASGDTSGRTLRELDRYLETSEVWENSWVRFPLARLNVHARAMLERDLLADKANPAAGPRQDRADFFRVIDGEEHLRVPISYLLKLALADLIGGQGVPEQVRVLGEGYLEHFSNDNTSPETFSFYPAPFGVGFAGGKGIARETSQRFLLCQLLADHANEAFGLLERGQRAVVYFAPLPPARQKQLNEIIPDAFYRELFMNPCLSGWDRGEAKKDYMGLCHRTLSRSQLNTLAKLRESGILTRNLVVLPNTSNTCLANNGTHISIGSRTLGALMGGGDPSLGAAGEKYVGDLAIKIVEHFLPLFVGTYSAAPMRMDFADFHPEKALGFLPHELDYTHLRMLWRRWKKKAKLKILGRPVTPFGPVVLDELVARVFGLRGDFVPDFRVLDYMTTLMSTHQCPALDGSLGNDARLKRDLDGLGVFHESMSTYLLYKQRAFGVMGFTGFEARFYSLFHSLEEDMRPAADLQQLLTCLAYKLILTGRVTHAHIPDTPEVESERRQIFFATAMDLPTFFVRQDSTNAFLASLAQVARRTRPSHRYPGRQRVYNQEYRLSLIEFIEREGADLVEMCQAKGLLADLRLRVLEPRRGAGGKLTDRILDRIGAKTPHHVRAREFNLAAEDLYRSELRLELLAEAMDYLEEDCRTVTDFGCLPGQFCRTGLPALLGGRDVLEFMAEARRELREHKEINRSRGVLTNLLLLVIGMHADNARVRARK